ncbi:IS21 family transposase [Granulicoccus phenolivorans]|uniref:IS21 family transposase n=1 Tax=Granulicoccus phenolivorans TaxID=266854 RepID=UPI0009DC3274
MSVGSRVRVFEAIRRDRRDDPDVSIRELAVRHGVHRRTVRQALASAEPPPRKVPVRTAPVLDPVKPLIDAMLRQDLDAPRKQRHTALRVRERLLDEHQVEVAYSTVRDYVRDARVRIAAEAGKQLSEVFVPQTHPAGAEAEVDFADLWIVWAGVKTKVFLFTLRLSYSGKAIHRAYATCSQEAFLDGHRYAFEQLGGIPIVHIRYDNLKAAVSRVLTGRTRVESDRWVLFRSHYGFDVFYCRPGVEGAHEKGGVEGEGGRFRRTHTVPMPKVETLAELNAYLAKCDAKDDHRRVGQRTKTVGDDFAVEQPLLRPLPVEPFETGISLRPRVDRHARVTVRQCQYSVPVRYVGRQLRVLLRATVVLIYDGPRLVAEHERATIRGSVTLVLDHYLEVLAYKPGALPGATALVQARKSGAFTAVHERYWSATKARYGDKAGTQALVEALLLHRSYPHSQVLAGLEAALQVGALSPEAVAVEVRRAGETRPQLGLVGADGQVTYPTDTRPLPSVDAYDTLLTGGTPT